MNYYTAVSPFWLVHVSVCRRAGLLIVASPFWFVAVLTIDLWIDNRSDHVHAHHKGRRRLLRFATTTDYVCSVRRSLSQESFTRLVVALVLSRLDYCNRVLAGLSACYLSRLQSVLHAAAQLIHGVSRYDPVTPLLR